AQWALTRKGWELREGPLRTRIACPEANPRSLCTVDSIRQTLTSQPRHVAVYPHWAKVAPITCALPMHHAAIEQPVDETHDRAGRLEAERGDSDLGRRLAVPVFELRLEPGRKGDERRPLRDEQRLDV